MTAATHDGDLVERPRRWFDVIPATDQPWRCWFATLPAWEQRGYGPLDLWVEHRVDDLIEHADRVRLSIVPATDHFRAMWATFRRHHENLEDGYEYRRTRCLTWRAAALTVICRSAARRAEYSKPQNKRDANRAIELLCATMAELGPYRADGSDGYGGNFWHAPAGVGGLPEYAQMVMTVVRRAT
jgi:hypothetical protein